MEHGEDKRRRLMSNERKWQDLSGAQKAGVVLLGTVQFALMGAALTDLRKRPARALRGSKALWTAASFVNFIGPIAYFVFGRKH
jgi:hypothetical protein